jgi:molybdate transport system regulatory protein
VSTGREDIHLSASVCVFIHSARTNEQTVSSTASDHKGVFGKDTAALLKGIRDLGSLNKATKSLGVDYSKSLARLHKVEQELGFKLYIRRPGRQGSALTRRGARLLNDYLSLCEACEEVVSAYLAKDSANYRHDHRRREEV